MILVAAALAAPPADETRYRTALLVSNNEAAGRTHLRYADTDAAKLAGVLDGLGGFVDDERLPGASADDLRRGLAALTVRVAAARARGQRVEVVVYYSGHSDDEGLLLGADHLPYSELRERIRAIGADVEVAILDWCASGSLIRAKGSVPHAPFLVDQSSFVSGTAVLTSSSADEASQESDRIGGSFFTTALVSGLRGAADTSQDHRVSLIEAYRFAYDETLARTESTVAGAQHAGYDLDLSGSGDLVITDLNATDATIEVDLPVRSRLFLWNEAGGLVAELASVPSRPVALAVPADRYTVLVDDRGEGTFDVAPGATLHLSGVALHPAAPTAERLRGGVVRHQVFSIGVVPPLLVGPPSPEILVQHAALSAGMAAADRLDGFQLSLGANLVRGDLRGLQLAFGGNAALGTAVGAQLGAVDIARRFDGVQIGLVNVGGAVRGAQIGLVNIGSEVTGAQIGVVNLSGRIDGVPVGLVSLSRHGYNHGWLLATDGSPVTVGVTSGGDRLYTVLELGHPRHAQWSGGVGLGFHSAVGDRGLVDVDLTAQAVDRRREADSLAVRLRGLAGFAASPHLAIVGGPTASIAPIDRGSEAPSWLPVTAIAGMPAWVGFGVGLRIW